LASASALPAAAASARSRREAGPKTEISERYDRAGSSTRGARRDQLPVGVGRACVAREDPDIDDLVRLGAAIEDMAVAVLGDVDLITDDLDGDIGAAAVEARLD